MDGISLLRWVTLVYVAILVLALATSLTAIGIFLWRIAAGLGRVREALAIARDRLAVLPLHLQPISQLTDHEVQRFEDAARRIERAAGISNEVDVIQAQVSRL